MTHRGTSLLVAAALAGALVACGSDAASGPGIERNGEPDRLTAADPPSCPEVAQGTVLARSLTSTVTEGVEHLRIYVPPGFEQAGHGEVPLLVLLHGSSADETQWIDVGIAAAADCMIGAGEIKPMMIVTVDGSRVDDRFGGADPPMEHLVADEVLPYLRHRYPQLGGRAVTGIGGISRGGGWALRIAADHPELFTSAGGHSPTTDLSDAQLRSLTDHQVRLWLDVGNQDRSRARIQRLASRIRSSGYGVMAMSWDGSHDRRYWSHHLEDYLRFYAQAW